MPSGIYVRTEANTKQCFKKGNKLWIKSARTLGKRLSEETKEKMKKSAKRGKDNFNWKGDDSSYRAKHYWIENNYGKAVKCSICSKTGSGREIHWANKDHKYRLKREDWFEACSSCHAEYDRVNNLRRHK